MGAKSNVPLGHDVLRGIRWGMIFLIVALLGITVYRIFGSGQANAAPVAPRPDAAPVASESDAPPAIQAGEGTLSTPSQTPSVTGLDVPVAPPPRRRIVQPDPEPEAKEFIPPQIVSPREAIKQDLTADLPDAPALDVKPAPVGATPAPNMKREDKGSRAGKIARSVGRVFGIGRKEEAPPVK